MRNSVAKPIKNRVYGTFGKLGRDYQAKTFENWVWAIYKDGDHMEVKRFWTNMKASKDIPLEVIAGDLIPMFTSLVLAWNPIQIRDLGPRALYKLAKTYYKRGQYKEMEALFK